MPPSTGRHCGARALAPPRRRLLDAEEEDDYGRLLAYVYRSDGSMFNEALVREGYAQVATFPPNIRYLDRFAKAQYDR